MDTETPATTETPVETQPTEPTLAEKRKANLVKARAARKKKTPAQAPDNSIAASSVEVPGALLEIKDGQGHTWAVPAESSEDYRLYQSPREVEHFKGYDARFRYEFIRRDEIEVKITEGWVCVTRKELGLQNIPANTSPQNATNDGLHWVEDQVCIKKPEVLVERQTKAYNQYAREVANSMKGPKSVGRENLQHGQDGNLVAEEVNRQSTAAEPARVSR